jgi:hypothetical protein
MVEILETLPDGGRLEERHDPERGAFVVCHVTPDGRDCCALGYEAEEPNAVFRKEILRTFPLVHDPDFQYREFDKEAYLRGE